jgi:two-component system sensor histidine kinase ChiS
VIGAGLWRVDRSAQLEFQATEKAAVLQELSLQRARLEAGLNSRLHVTYGLIAYTKVNPDLSVEEFTPVARSFIRDITGVRSIQLARDSVVTHVYPVAGNEAVVGMDLLAQPERRVAVERTIKDRQTVVTGPIDLVQGGKAFISRTPIFTAVPGESTGDTQYWGLATILITSDVLFEEAGLTHGSSVIRSAIRGNDASGAPGDVFFGEANVFTSNPVLLDVTLPSGSWQMGAIPADGWGALAPDSVSHRIQGMFLASLVGILVFLFVWNLIRLRAEIVGHIQTESRLMEKHENLENALSEIKTLEGLLPICAACKKIRDEGSSWNRVEVYLQSHSDATFTHGLCPECLDTHYGEYAERVKRKDGP